MGIEEYVDHLWKELDTKNAVFRLFRLIGTDLSLFIKRKRQFEYLYFRRDSSTKNFSSNTVFYMNNIPPY